MSDLNNVTILGRLIREPEVRYPTGGIAVASFSIAANHPYKDKSGQWKDEVAFVPCVAFGKAADLVASKEKGEPILATGRLRTETWQKDGTNHSRLVLVTETLHAVAGALKASSTVPAKENTPMPGELQKAVPF